jgi:hypothetical protein
MQRPAFTWALPLQILRPWKFSKTVRLDTAALLCVLIVFIVTALIVFATSPTGIVDSKLFPVHHRRVGGDSDDGDGGIHYVRERHLMHIVDDDLSDLISQCKYGNARCSLFRLHQGWASRSTRRSWRVWSSHWQKVIISCDDKMGACRIGKHCREDYSAPLSSLLHGGEALICEDRPQWHLRENLHQILGFIHQTYMTYLHTCIHSGYNDS